MKKLIVKNDEVLGRKTKVTAQNIYETVSGNWVAEVEGSELRQACLDLCSGIDHCSCDHMHGEADLDDDGKEYRLVSR